MGVSSAQGYIIGFAACEIDAEQLINEHYKEAVKGKTNYLQMLKHKYPAYAITGDRYFTTFHSITDGSLTISSMIIPSNFNVSLFISERQQKTSNYNHEQMDLLINVRAFKEVFNPN